MNHILKRLIGGLTAVCLLAGTALAADITPSTTAITLRPGVDTITFDITLSSDQAFAGAEFGIRPSGSDVKFRSLELLDDVRGGSSVRTEKNGTYYFGFFAGSNRFAPGDYDVARLTYSYSGTADRTISLVSSKIVTINEETNTTIGDTSTPGFSISVVRSADAGGGGSEPGGGGGIPGGGSGGGGAGGGSAVTPSNPDISVTERVEKADGTVVETVTDQDGNRTVVETAPDGSVRTEIVRQDGFHSETVTDAGGQTHAEVTMPAGAANDALNPDGTLPLPLPQLPVSEGQSAQIQINTGRTEPTTVIIPVTRPNSGIVAVRIHDDGSRTLLPVSEVTDVGVLVRLTGPATLDLVCNAGTFDDMVSHWAQDAVTFVCARELFQGTGSRQFSPDMPMTRGMMATVLWRLENCPAEAASASIFTDVAAGSWYSEAVNWAANQDIINGFGSDRFGPDQMVTREQLVVMLFRYAAAQGLDVSVRDDLSGFPDRDRVSDWARDPMSWAVSVGLISGRSGGLLDPTSSASRAEVAVIFQRMVHWMLH